MSNTCCFVYLSIFAIIHELFLKFSAIHFEATGRERLRAWTSSTQEEFMNDCHICLNITLFAQLDDLCYQKVFQLCAQTSQDLFLLLFCLWYTFYSFRFPSIPSAYPVSSGRICGFIPVGCWNSCKQRNKVVQKGGKDNELRLYTWNEQFCTFPLLNYVYSVVYGSWLWRKNKLLIWLLNCAVLKPWTLVIM